MKRMDFKKMAVAGILGIGMLTAVAPTTAQAAPRYRYHRRRNANAYRQFTGRTLADNSSGDLMQVRADSGTTYTVRSTKRIRGNRRVSVSGYLRNGIIEDATVIRVR